MFVRKTLLPLISGVKSYAVSTGIPVGPSHRLGNKGGIGIAFNIVGTSFVFINSHLAQGSEGLSKRNEEYFTITSQLSKKLISDKSHKDSSI